jgi:tricorn protease
VDAKVGDHVISVNGRDVKAGENLYAAFDDTAGRQVELVLSANASGEPARTVTVVPLANDGELRRRAWIESNRRRVDELSGGRLAYVYMPNTANEGQAAFDRDYYGQIGKDGLILDERFNGGGKVADYVLSVLARKPMCYWMTREGWLGRTPFGTMTGPKVMVIDERAGSGGDALPWLFRRLGIGPLVGTRTWGGLVGITGYPPLMDGGSVTAAAFGVMDTDGQWAVENVGVAPDVEVIEKPKDVIVGHDPQLEKAIDVALRLLEKTPSTPLPVYKPPTPR